MPQVTPVASVPSCTHPPRPAPPPVRDLSTLAPPAPPARLLPLFPAAGGGVQPAAAPQVLLPQPRLQPAHGAGREWGSSVGLWHCGSPTLHIHAEGSALSVDRSLLGIGKQWRLRDPGLAARSRLVPPCIRCVMYAYGRCVSGLRLGPSSITCLRPAGRGAARQRASALSRLPEAAVPPLPSAVAHRPGELVNAVRERGFLPVWRGAGGRKWHRAVDKQFTSKPNATSVSFACQYTTAPFHMRASQLPRPALLFHTSCFISGVLFAPTRAAPPSVHPIPPQSCAQHRTLHAQQGEDAALLGVAGERGWKPCPQCRALVELAHGCNHITCKCGAEWCYKCGALWKKPPGQRRAMATCRWGRGRGCGAGRKEGCCICSGLARLGAASAATLRGRYTEVLACRHPNDKDFRPQPLGST